MTWKKANEETERLCVQRSLFQPLAKMQDGDMSAKPDLQVKIGPDQKLPAASVPISRSGGSGFFVSTRETAITSGSATSTDTVAPAVAAPPSARSAPSSTMGDTPAAVAGGTASSPGGATGSSPRGFVSAVPTQVIAQAPAATTASAATGASTGSTTAPAASSTAKIPVVFADPSAVASFPADQQSGIAQIANDFSSAVQSSGVSPTSPEYKKIWDTAAFQADQQYEAMYGIDALNKMMMSQSN